MYHLRRLPIFVLILILLMTLLPIGPSIQNVNALSPVHPNEKDSSLDDAEIYAKHMGVSIDEALHRFHIQDVAGELDAELSVNEEKTFAGLWIEQSPEFRIVVQFTQDANQKIKPYITKELGDILTVQTAKVSLADLQNNQIELISSLADLEIPAETEINIIENNIKLFIAEADKMRFDNASRNGLLQFSDYIEILTVPEMGKVEANIYGGLPLSACNTSFAVQNSQGLRGVTTAAHCANSLSYNGTTLTFQSEIKTGSYDVQWHTPPPYTVTNLIRISTTGTTRNITSTQPRSSQVVGGYVCKYGVTTGYTCGYISSKNFSSSGVPNSAATFIRVNNTGSWNDLSSSGDSGGPWFLTNTAYGVHHGSPSDDPNDAIYMAVNYISGLGVSVLTNP